MTDQLSAFAPLPHLARPSPKKILLMVIDGLGGLPGPDGKTELEAANLPNLDALTSANICGLMDPVARGITPGSGPGHLGLFGYDPLVFEIGRGALEAAGIGFELGKNDVAARFNFCTLDKTGNITDRRAGRISTEKNRELVPLLRQVKIQGVEIFVEAVREHRGLVVFRGEKLGENVEDTDPQLEGVPPLPAKASDPDSRRTAEVANDFLAKAREALTGQHPANGMLLRGFACLPKIPTLQELYKLKPAGVALYPMYRGLASYAGMNVPAEGIQSFDDELAKVESLYAEHDFIFLHYKHADSAGEDGDFDKKVQCLEQADAAIPRLLRLKPDVLVVTGDHSTPCVYKGHSWHPVPVVMKAPFIRPDEVTRFTERACLAGGLGRFRAKELMTLMLTHADKLEKFGA